MSCNTSISVLTEHKELVRNLLLENDEDFFDQGSIDEIDDKDGYTIECEFLEDADFGIENELIKFRIPYEYSCY